MNIHDFRRIALSFEGAEESSHMAAPTFAAAAESSPLSPPPIKATET